MNDLKNISCCFTGHRKLLHNKNQDIFDKTLEKVEILIKQGYCYFNTAYYYKYQL